MRSLLLSVALVVALLAVGCSTTPLPPKAVAIPQGRETPLHRVALVAGDEARTEALVMFGRPSRIMFKTGEPWKRAFDAPVQGADAVLALGSSSLEWKIVAAGFAGQIVYTVDAVLSANSREQPIHAEGTKTFAADMEGALAVPVEEAIASVSSQISALVVPTSRPPVADRLRELTRLLNEGLITKEEYEAKRKALVDQL